jgi:hypothetical protein
MKNVPPLGTREADGDRLVLQPSPELAQALSRPGGIQAGGKILRKTAALTIRADQPDV